MFAKVLGTVVFLGSLALAPANAEPVPSGPTPSPFDGLTCDCQQTAPADGATLAAEVQRGLSTARHG
jgi:hypothetical protein